MSKSTENWKCHACGKDNMDTLYFVGNEELCWNCRREIKPCEKEMTPDRGNRKENEGNGEKAVH